MKTDPTKGSAGSLGLLQVFIGATLISFSPVFVKLARVDPTAMGFYRMLIGGLVLSAASLARGKRLFTHRRDLGFPLACGLFFALDLIFWHRSIRYVGPGLGTLLSNFQVFFLAGFGAVFLSERPTPRLAAAIPMAVTGLVLILGPTWDRLGADYRLGVAFGLVTALCYSAYLLTLRWIQGREKGPGKVANMALISLFTAALLGPATWVNGESFFIPDPGSWLSVLGYGVVSQVVGWVLIAAGLPRLETSRAGLVLLLQPTLAFVWDILFFARPTRAAELFGAGLALAAIYLGTTGVRRV